MDCRFCSWGLDAVAAVTRSHYQTVPLRAHTIKLCTHTIRYSEMPPRYSAQAPILVSRPRYAMGTAASLPEELAPPSTLRLEAEREIIT